MHDRGMIKWQPFDSLFSSSLLKHEILEKKNKISKPILSDEQKNQIERDLVEAYHGNISIKIIYFQNNNLFTLTKKITKINFINKKIILEDNFGIFFDQIISTKI